MEEVAEVSLSSPIRVAPLVEVAAESAEGIEEETAPETPPETTRAQARPAVAQVTALATAPAAETMPEPVQPVPVTVAVAVSRVISRSSSEKTGFPPGAEPDARLVILREPDSPRAASYRVLRHRLAERGDPRVLVIASALPSEGKTQCAANLALAGAEAARGRVLLVDANLRAPAMASMFELLPAMDPVAARLPAWPWPAPWSVFKRFSPWLDVVAIAPGQATGGPPDGAAWGHLMDGLRNSSYDRIVIDGPAVLGAADINLIEDYVDAVLLVAWSRRSSSRALKRAVEQLEPVKLAGITLLDAR
jgi:Mrp family chromosome partitioning ATPase